MLNRKNFNPTNHCSNIRELYRSALEERRALEIAYQRAGQIVDETQRPFFGFIDAADKPRLQAEARDAHQAAERIKSELESVKKKIKDIANDYAISGCSRLLGPL